MAGGLVKAAAPVVGRTAVKAAPFNLQAPAQVIYGRGALIQAGPLAAELGQRALIVGGSSRERAEPLFSLLSQHGVEAAWFSVPGEPSLETARSGVQAAQAAACDLVIGFGGGSALDAGKAIAVLMTNPGDPLDYIEVFGAGKPFSRPGAPFIAIPTTAGTGSEVTRNAVLSSPEHQAKASLRSALMLPRAAIIDPALSDSLPPHVTAMTGLDALTQVIEPYLCSRANPLTDALCAQAIPAAAEALPHAYRSGTDQHARDVMAYVSLCGGLALSNAGLGAVHGFAGPFGGMFDAPHGAVCGALLPHVFAVNAQALAARSPDHPALPRFTEVARWLTGDDAASIEEGAAWLQDLVAALQVPRLATYGLDHSSLPELIDKAGRSSSMKANPIPLTDAEKREILLRAL